jgi:hypothetical protein
VVNVSDNGDISDIHIKNQARFCLTLTYIICFFALTFKCQNVTLKMMENIENSVKPVVVQQEPLRTLVEWDAMARTFKKRDKEFFRTIFSLLILVVIILFFAQQFMLILAIIATAFLAYVLNTVPPEMVHHKITTQGVVTAEHAHPWKELKSFFFSEKHGEKILNVDTVAKFPGRLMLLFRNQDQGQMKDIMSKYLLFKEQAPVMWLDRASSWLSAKVPLEKS